MGMAKLTLMGMYYWWMNNEAGDFFDSLNLPTSSIISAANFRTQVKNAILVNGGEFGCLYGDPSWMRTMMSMWSGTMLPIWQRMLDALELKYNPIENYDRQEEWRDTENGIISRTGKTSGNGTSAGMSTQTTEGNPETTESVSAYNTTTFSPDKKTEITLDEKQKSSSTVVNKDTKEETGKETHNNATFRSGRTHGNIGVTTSQQMLMSEIDVAQYNSMYNYIADDFMRQFLILCY